MSLADTILKLTKQLYPTGRAFKMPYAGPFEKLHRGLALSESRAYSDAKSILDSALPDNSNFSTADAALWEKRLGLIVNTMASLEDRKLSIKRKMNHPGLVLPRQNFRYVEGQLQAAGFNVFVYENRFDYSPFGYQTQDPLVITGGVGGNQNQYGEFQYGDAQYGSGYTNIVANDIDEEVDAVFNVGSNLKNTFFIGGTPLGTFANVDINRKRDFRQLVLKLKPVQTVAFLFINYV